MPFRWRSDLAPDPAQGPPWLPAVVHRNQLDIQWLLVAGLLFVAGVIFFGPRGVMSVVIAALSTLIAFVLMTLLIQLIRPRFPRDSVAHALTMGLLLGLSMPVMRERTLPVLAGLMLGLLLPFVGRVHRLRLHAVAAVLLTVWCVPPLMMPASARTVRPQSHETYDAVLRPGRVVLGDLANLPANFSYGSWWGQRDPDLKPALRRYDPAVLLINREERKKMLLHEGWLIRSMRSTELVSMDELLLGAAPGPVGGSSRALVIVLGVYLMYRRLGSWRSALASILTASAVLMLMPVRENENGTRLVISCLLDLPGPVAITFIGYQILASPLVVMTLILAPMTLPMSNRGRWVYGFTMGAVGMSATWAMGTPYAAYAGLVVASLMSRPLDVMKRSPWAK